MWRVYVVRCGTGLRRIEGTLRLRAVIAEAAPHWGLIIVLPGTVTAQDKQRDRMENAGRA